MKTRNAKVNIIATGASWGMPGSRSALSQGWLNDTRRLNDARRALDLIEAAAIIEPGENRGTPAP